MAPANRTAIRAPIRYVIRTAGPATCTPRLVLRKKPMPRAPPIPIMAIWRALSCRSRPCSLSTGVGAIGEDGPDIIYRPSLLGWFVFFYGAENPMPHRAGSKPRPLRRQNPEARVTLLLFRVPERPYPYLLLRPPESRARRLTCCRRGRRCVGHRIWLRRLC